MHFFDTKQDQIAPADQIISDPNTVILTTAVGESHLSSIAQVIAAGLKKRANTAPSLLILACENGHRSSHRLADEVEKCLSVKEYNGRFIDCIVDQICVNWIKHPDNTFVTLSAETYREWVIEDHEPDRLRELLKHECIRVVPTAHFDIYEIRKLWLVNGFHLALAILGFAIFEDPDTPISKVLESTDSRLSDRIVEIKAELVNALMFKDEDGVFSRRDLEAYINEVEKRFRVSPDICRRILWNPLHDRARIEKVALEFGNALGKDERLSDVLSDSLYECIFTFFGKVQDRLYDPMKILLGQRGCVYCF